MSQMDMIIHAVIKSASYVATEQCIRYILYGQELQFSENCDFCDLRMVVYSSYQMVKKYI